MLETISIILIREGNMNPDATAQLVKLARRTYSGHEAEVEPTRLKEVLERGADPNTFVNKEGQTILLQYMEIQHSPDCVTVLLNHGGNPDLYGKRPKYRYELGEGETPLTIAISTAYAAYALRWCKELVAAGADVNLRDSRGHTALDHVLVGLVGLIDHVEDAFNSSPSNEIIMFGATQVYFMRAKPLIQGGELLIEHGAEAPIAKGPADGLLDHARAAWNRCVDWQNGTK